MEKQIPGLGNWWVSDLGKVFRKTDGFEPSVQKHQKGYLRVYLRHEGKTHYKFVHQLVLTTFSGPCPEGMMCRHLNGNPSDNRLDNLKWGTNRENTEDRIRHGRIAGKRGLDHPRARLTVEQVLEIRKSNEPAEELGKRFGIAKHHAVGIRLGYYWRSVPFDGEPPPLPKSRQRDYVVPCRRPKVLEP